MDMKYPAENDGKAKEPDNASGPAFSPGVQESFTLPHVSPQFIHFATSSQDTSNAQLEYQRSLLMQQYQLQAQYQMLQYSMMQYPNAMMPMMQVGVGYPGYPQPVLTVEMMHAHNIEELKRFVSLVGAQDVKRVIEQSKIVPREMAYTSLIQMAGKMRQVDKAVAIFEAMRGSKHAVKPNMYSYTALISALARVGDWELAEKYFSEMSRRAETDPSVAPNRVTFSSMISVYEKAGKFDSAIQIFEKQIEAKIQPDLITYLSVLGACKASGEPKALERSVDIINEMHASGIVGTPAMYLGLLSACDKLPRVALRVFESMGRHHVEISPSVYNAVMQSLFTAGLKDEAVELARKADMASIRLNHVFFDSVLKLCSEAGDYPSADIIHGFMIKSRIQMSPQIAGLILSAHMQGNDSVEIIEQLNNCFKMEGVTPLLPVRKEVVECVHEVMANTVSVSDEKLNTKVMYELSDMSTHSEVDATIA